MRRAAARFVLGAVLAAQLAGAACSASDPPLRVALLIWPAYELPYLAEMRGYLPAGIELVPFRSPAEAQRAYEQRLVDAAALTLGFAVRLRTLEPENRVVFVIDYSAGGDALIARPEIESIESLRGRRVAVETSVLGLHLLDRSLASAGLTPGDVEIVPMDVARHPEAFEDEDVAAVVTYEPYRSRLLERGGRELFDSRRIPGEIVDVLVTRDELVHARRTELEGLVEAWLRAGREAGEDPEALDALARRQSVSPEVFGASLRTLSLVDLEANRRLLDGSDPALAETAERLQELLVRLGVIDRPGSLEGLFDPRIVEGLSR